MAGMTARRLICGLAIAAALAACGGSAPPGDSPRATLATAPEVTPSPTEAPAPTPAVTPTATPVPTPTLAQLSRAYANAAIGFNKAALAAERKYKKTTQGLAATKALHKAYAALDLKFIRALQATAWWGDTKPVAARLIRLCNQDYVLNIEASKARNWADLNSAEYKLDKSSDQRRAAANELRLLLGLKPLD
jgi:hypothetical protein